MATSKESKPFWFSFGSLVVVVVIINLNCIEGYDGSNQTCW
jgi:hypothetical protein